MLSFNLFSKIGCCEAKSRVASLATIALLSFGLMQSAQAAQCPAVIPGVLPNVAGERNSGTDYRANYHPNNAANNGQTNLFDATNGLSGTVNGDDGGTPISTNYSITRGAGHHGFGATRYSRNQSGKILVVSQSDANVNSDVMQYQIDLAGTTAGYQAQVTLRQSLNLHGQNNEAADWTFTWSGGGNAVFYDDAAPTTYPANDATTADRLYAHGYPSGFDVNEREIVGTSTTGQFASGGGFRAYFVTNRGTRWRVVFPPGATNIVATKTILHGGTNNTHGIGTPYNYTDDANDGIDSGYPKFGQFYADWVPTYYSGEGFNEFLTYQVDFVKDNQPDADGDGIPDCQDLDDDNDGILDVVECNRTNVFSNAFSYSSGTDWVRSSSTGTLPGFGATHKGTAVPGLLYRNNNNDVSTLTQNISFPSYADKVIDISFAWFNTTTTVDTQLTVEFLYGGQPYGRLRSSDNNGIFMSWEALNGAQVSGIVPPDRPNSDLTVAGNWSDDANLKLMLPSSVPASADFTIRFTAGSDSANVDDINIYSVSSSYCQDTDGDGIPNNLDLDSDNDGCADAREGGGTLTNLLAALGTVSDGNGGVVTQNLGNTVNTDPTSASYGVPTVAGAGQTTGVSQDPSKNECADIDGDGVPDWSDKDDDNDGILDCSESGLGNNLADLFTTIGNASIGTGTTPQEITLAPNATQQQGQAWATQRVDFTKDFTLRTQAYLGTEDVNGADGIAIVFHNDPNGIATQGLAGVGLGYAGIANGLALELDTWYNANSGTGFQPNDIRQDHGSINRTNDGSLLSTAIALPDLEDNAWHDVVVTWDVSAGRLHYTVDGQTAGTYTNPNIATDIFGGSSEVYFGFTASTGAATNLHKVRFPNTCETFLDLFATDTDGDGIPNHLDLDSDNDGCLDAIEGAGTFTATDLINATGVTVGTGSSASNQNLGNTVDTNTASPTYGVPTVAGSGQAVGNSQVATKLEFDTSATNGGQPQDATITIGATGQTATFTAVGVATSTTTFNASNQPDYSGTTTAGTVRYQWQRSTDGGTTWTDIAGATSASYAQTNVTAAMNGHQYKVIVTCDENVCVNLEATATLTVNQPMYNMAKTVNPTSINAPGTLTYTFAFTNNGNVALQNLTVTDPDIDAGTLTNCPITSLAVGASASCTATRTITQAQINAGTDITNTATPSADFNDGTTTVPASEDNDGDPSTPNDTTDNTATTTVGQTLGLVLTKTSSTASDTNGDGIIGQGDVITYSFEVENTGNVDLTNVTITDAKLGLSNQACVASLPASTKLACSNTFTHTITQADVVAGGIENTATATATDTNGTSVTDTSDSTNPNDTGANDDHNGDNDPNNDPTRTPLTADPRMSLTKSSSEATDTNGDGIVGAGDTITYTFNVENTGNVDLTNVTITDTKLGLSGVACVASLLVNTQSTCSGTYTYTLTQADVNAGSVNNTATGSATDPSGNPVTDTSDSTNPNDTGANDDHDGDGDPSNDPTRTPITASPSMALTKSSTQATDTNGDGLVGAGDTLTYTFTVSNTGNVPISNVTLTDAKLNLTNEVCVATLAVGASDVACANTYNYVLTQDDVNAGKVENTATATGQDPSGNDTSDISDSGNTNDASGDDDVTVVDLTQTPAFELTKSSTTTDVDNDGLIGVGDQIVYRFTVTNTGNVPITNLLLTDSKLGISNETCVATLAVGATDVACTGNPYTYTVTQADVNAGKVENTATATGKDPNGNDVSDTSDSGNDNDPGGDNDPTVTPISLPPAVAVADVEEGTPGQPVSVNVTANDGTVDPTTVQIIDPNTGNPLPQGTPLVVPNEGTWTVNSTTGVVTFTPAPGFTGNPTPITYTVKDQNGTPATATVTVLYPNPAGQAQNDTQVGTPGQPVTVPVLNNDGDNKVPDTVKLIDPTTGNPVNSVTVPNEGTWTVDTTTGDVTFTPIPGYTGTNPKPINYQVNSSDGVTSKATITVSYPAVASTAAVNDVQTGVTGQPTVVDVLANDGGSKKPETVRIIDANGNPVTSLTVPGEGTWTVNTSTGQITFQPEAGFTGSPKPIQYTVEDNNGQTASATVTVTYPNPASTPAVAVADVEEGTPGQPVSVNVTANDGTVDPTTVQIIDPNTGNPLPQGTALVVPNEGSWTVDSSTGEVTFTPLSTFTGNPTPITYTVKDKNGTPSTATVTVRYPKAAGSAQNDTTTGETGKPIVVPVLDNDGANKVPSTVKLIDPVSKQPVTSVTVPNEGTWSVDTTTGEVTFTPESGYTGTNPTPIDYQVTDTNGNTSIATVTVSYPKVSSSSAVNDVEKGTPGQPVTIDVLGNDGGNKKPDTVRIVDGSGNPVTSLTVPGEGTWTVDSSTGKITFTPLSTFTGNPKPIQYTVEDTNGRSSSATVTVKYPASVGPVTPPPAPKNIPATGGLALLLTGLFMAMLGRRRLKR